MNTRLCPRWERCSAPICPLDPLHLASTHRDGERICFWLIEAAKRGGRLPDDPRLAGALVAAVEESYPRIVDRFGPVRWELKRAARRGSRLEKALGGLPNG